MARFPESFLGPAGQAAFLDPQARGLRLGKDYMPIAGKRMISYQQTVELVHAEPEGVGVDPLRALSCRHYLNPVVRRDASPEYRFEMSWSWDACEHGSEPIFLIGPISASSERVGPTARDFESLYQNVPYMAPPARGDTYQCPDCGFYTKGRADAKSHRLNLGHGAPALVVEGFNQLGQAIVSTTRYRAPSITELMLKSAMVSEEELQWIFNNDQPVDQKGRPPSKEGAWDHFADLDFENT